MFGKLKTLSCITAIGCIVFLFVLASATAADKTTWMKYTNAVPGTSDSTNWGKGRIPLGTNTKGDDKYASHPSVIKDGSIYKMWYSGIDVSGNKWQIYYATSSDGLIWTKFNNAVLDPSNTTGTDGRIPLGTSGGDSAGAYFPTVIKDDSTYKMWYSGGDGTNARIYYATSPNGLTWTKYTNAVPPASNTTGTKGRIPLGTSGGDTKYAIFPTVIKDGSTYKMWYTGSDSTNYRIYHATSPDGLNWTKYTNAVPGNTNTTSTLGRIPLGTTGGDINDAGYPTVIKVRSTYKMWYVGKAGSTRRIYHATSTDGLTWTKYDNSIPDDSNTISTNGRIPVGESGGDTVQVVSPCVIKDGYFYKMWYAGSDGNYRIYHATLDALPEGTIFYGH